MEKGIQIALRYLENKLTRLINRGVLIKLTKSHNRTERDSQGVGRDILISKKLFLELCGP